MVKRDSDTKPNLPEFKVGLKAVGYCRVSTDDQADYGTSLDTQQEAIEAYAEQAGIEIASMLRDDFSGRRLDRPQFSRVRQMIRDGLVNCLIVYNPNRLTRHRTHIMMIVDELIDYGCELHVVSKGGPVNLTDDTAIMMLSMEAHFGHKEVNEIAERTKRGRDKKARDGHFMGPRPAYGYKVVKETKETAGGRIITLSRKLEIEPDEAPTVRRIFALYGLQGQSCSAIAKQLNDSGSRFRSGNYWQSWHIHKILIDPVHKGQHHYKKIVTEVEAIVTPELWELAAEARIRNKQHKRWTSDNYLLSGRIRCEHCRAAMVGTANGRYFAYRCAAAYHTGHYYRDRRCTNRRNFRTDLIEPVILEWIEKLFTDESVLQAAIDLYVEEKLAESKPLTDDRTRIEKHLAVARARLERLIDSYLDGVLDAQGVAERRLTLHSEIEQAESALSDINRQLSEIDHLPERVKNIKALRAVVAKAVQNGILDKHGKEICEALDVRVTLEWREDVIVVRGSCIIDDLEEIKLWPQFRQCAIISPVSLT